MATDNRPDASVSEAQLSSLDGSYVLVIGLFPLLELKHRDWLGYELHMLEARTGERFSVAFADGHGLFFDRTVEPEVPSLCAKLKAVVERKESFVFEPLDERDFRLEVRPEGAGAVARLQFAHKVAPDSYGWPIGVEVSEESLLSFAHHIQQALDRVEQAYSCGNSAR